MIVVSLRTRSSLASDHNKTKQSLSKCGAYLIRLRGSPPSSSSTMIATADLESAIRTAIPVTHLDIIDQSSGCGENYAILVVSEVCRGHFAL